MTNDAQKAPTAVREGLDADLKRKGMSKKDFASEVGVSYEAVRKWEVENRVPDAKIDAIGRVLGPDSRLIAMAQKHEHSAREPAPPGYGSPPPKPHLANGARLRELLPEQYRDCVDRAEGLGTLRRVYDYSSSKLLLEMKSLTTLRELRAVASQAAMQLLTARALANSAPEERKYAVALVTPWPLAPHDYRDTTQQLAAELGLQGIALIDARSVEQVADYIVAVEESKP